MTAGPRSQGAAPTDWLRERLVAHSDGTCGPVNSVPYVFLDPGARDFYVDRERAASDVIAVLRSTAGHDPYEPRDPGQMLMIWTAEPGTKPAEALSLLGSWAATPDQPEREEPPGHP